MRATRMSFVRVEKGATPAPAVIRAGVEEVSDFLSAHARGLIDRANDGSAANARFFDPSRGELLDRLRSGDEAEFLESADLLAARLVEEMNHVGNPAPGLLVCVTLEDGAASSMLAAVLKLEVVSDQGAVLRRLETGEETLAAVTNVLDRPGDLQKGLVVPDVRSESSAVVGDKAAQQEARYFLRSMGVTLEARPNATAGALVAAVGRLAGRPAAQQVALALPTVVAGSPRAVLEQIQGQGVTLPEAAVAAVVGELEQADRPVPRIEVGAAVRARIRAGALTVTGSASDVAAVEWSRDPAGGWTVQFHSDTEPTVSWT